MYSPFFHEHINQHLDNKRQEFAIMTELLTSSMPSTSFYYYDPPVDIHDSFLNSQVKAAVFYMVFALGLIGNVTVIWVIFKSMHVKSMTNLCLLNLALSDLLMVLSLPFWALYVQGHSINHNGMCMAMAATYQVGFYSGILFVTLMSVDRYVVIVHAVAMLRSKMLRYGTVVSVIIWVVSICASLPEVIFAAVVTEDNITTCERIYPEDSETTWKLLRNCFENAVGLFISLPVIAYCYIRVLLVVRKTKNSKKERAIKLILGIVTVFVVFWVPYNVMVFLHTLQEFGFLKSSEAYQQINKVMDLTQMIALTHCCVNPAIYAFVGEKFRKYLATMFSRYILCMKTYQSTQSHSKLSENDTSNTAIFFTSPSKTTQV